MSACIITTHGKDSHGYGAVRLNGKVVKAHRLAYATHHNITLESMKNLVIIHKCDNPSCVNPDHLVLGTHADNMFDMAVKGRAGKGPGLIGTKHPQAKLTEQDVLLIKELLATTNRTLESIGKQFNVLKGTIHAIKVGRLWKHIKYQTTSIN